jgi:hypothetical protein
MPSDGKSSHCLWKGLLKRILKCEYLLVIFADDIAPISSTQQQMQETSIKLGLRPNKSKTKVMKINAKRKDDLGTPYFS